MKVNLKHTPLGANARKPNTYTLEIPEDLKDLIEIPEDLKDLIETLTEHFVNRFSLELPAADGKKMSISGTYTVIID